MDKLALTNPIFATYVIAATIMVLKAVSMSWLTVLRMLQENAGFRSPEDLRRTPLNPSPDPKQLQPNERVERIRRIHLNDLENLPFFLIAGLLFVFAAPSLLWAQLLLYGYVVSRLLRRLLHGADARHARNPVDDRLADFDRDDSVDADRGAQGVEFTPAGSASWPPR